MHDTTTLTITPKTGATTTGMVTLEIHGVTYEFEPLRARALAEQLEIKADLATQDNE